MLFLVPFAASDINSFDMYRNGSTPDIVENGDKLEFLLNASADGNASVGNASISISNPGSTVLSDQMTLIQNTSFKIFQYNYTLNTNNSGEWSATADVTINGSSETASTEFKVATDDPYVFNLTEDPVYLKTGSNITLGAWVLDSGQNVDAVNVTFSNSTRRFQMSRSGSSGDLSHYSVEYPTEQKGSIDYTVTAFDSGGNRGSASGFYQTYGYAEGTNVSVKIAPSCSTSLDYFLLPGDGEIVQNKTGVFVEIASNTGNVESNITIDYLNVTYEGDSAWSRGQPKGPVIRSYPGEQFNFVRIGESITYFKLFLASYQLGNYTGRSSITTACNAEGAVNNERNKDELNSSFNCDNLSAETFGCYNFSVVDTDLVVSETVPVNLTTSTSKTVDAQVSGTTGYTGNGTLNGTLYQFYSFNSSSTLEYDYACATPNSSIEESDECAYETSTISGYNIKVQEIAFDGNNATFSQLKQNNDYLNTTLDCSSVDNATARCNSTLKFLEQFSFFGNFEIVKSIGERQGGANQSGNETSNQSIPGDSPEPGQTEVPEPTPTPVPTPVPEPTPEVSVIITPHQNVYRTSQGVYAAATFNVTNVGNVAVENVSLIPQINRFREEWNVRNAQIANLSVNETVARDVFVQPPENAAPGTYVVPVTAESDGTQLDLNYFQLKVFRSEFIPRVSIEEAPQDINVPVETNRSIPLLIQNTGKTNLTNVSARIQNMEDCGSFHSDSVPSIAVNGTASLQITLTGGPRTANCNTTVVVSSAGGAYAFSTLQVTTIPEQGVIPPGQRVPLLAILWTLLLAGYAFFTRRFDLDSWAIRVPFLLIILGEALIILYTVVNYYSLPIASVLPF